MNKWHHTLAFRNALIWAAVLIGAAVILKGTDYFAQLLPIIVGGAVVSVNLNGVSEKRKKS